MSKWLIMKIPGTTKVQLSLLTILAISSVTSTSLLISQQVKSTSVESILCRSVNLKEARDELLLSQIGNAITGSCPELKEDIKLLGKPSFSREILSLHTTKGRTNYEETRQLFLHDVLTKTLTDGTPAFYNSNILGRYYRKDYFGNEDD